jgi:hypothetical protein
MSVSPIAPYLSMMDFVDLARRASSTSNVVSISELETMVRDALRDIVDAGESIVSGEVASYASGVNIVVRRVSASSNGSGRANR